jgi:hypothetical protein
MKKASSAKPKKETKVEALDLDPDAWPKFEKPKPLRNGSR